MTDVTPRSAKQVIDRILLIRHILTNQPIIIYQGLIRRSVDTLENGPWRPMHIVPEWPLIKKLSSRWPLRGADLWHLATAKTFQDQIPVTIVLTYDSKLKVAAHGEKMALL